MPLIFDVKASEDQLGKECDVWQSKSVKGTTKEAFGRIYRKKGGLERDIFIRIYN